MPNTIVPNNAPTTSFPDRVAELEYRLGLLSEENLLLKRHLSDLTDEDNYSVASAIVLNNNQNEVFKCPGHKKFFHYYDILSKAHEKGSKEAEKVSHKPNIECATYKVLQKGSIEALDAGYFSGVMGSWYNYAVDIIFYHNDDFRGCEFYPSHQSNANTVPDYL